MGIIEINHIPLDLIILLYQPEMITDFLIYYFYRIKLLSNGMIRCTQAH